MKSILLLSLFIFSLHTFGNDKLISFGDVQIGEDRINLILDDFDIVIDSPKENVKAILVPNSVQWIRNQSNLLIPRVRIKVVVKEDDDRIHAKYLNETIIPEKLKNRSLFDLYLNLFNPGKIYISQDKNVIGTITVIAKDISEKIKERNQKTKLIDYSCSRYQLEFAGLEHEYMSIGCKLERVGDWGKETPRLTVTWSTTNYTLLDGTTPPFKVILHGKPAGKIQVMDRNGKTKTISIRAKLPKRIHRLKTAIGFGPYMFEAQEDLKTRNERVAPALMFYGRYDLIKQTSLRFFNATVASGSVFNNAGVYFAYELADAFDGRLELMPLLGAQVLSFDFDDESSAYHKAIYPQGAEIVWNNAFNIENYTVVYGMFLSTSSRKKYKNLWVRWGRGYFWELNYISWEENSRMAKMWGLSVGLPLVQLF